MNVNIFKKIDLKAFFSSGVVNDRTVFVPPCILLRAIKYPKLRFKNQKFFWKEYLKKTGRKGLKDMTNPEYDIYLNESKKHGETKEYVKWRKYNKKKIGIVKELISDFNKTVHKKNDGGEITLLTFEDGTGRIESGNQFSMSVFKKRGKMKLFSKKLIMKAMIKKLELFVDFVGMNI